MQADDSVRITIGRSECVIELARSLLRRRSVSRVGRPRLADVTRTS
jgi:hypothetical protein